MSANPEIAPVIVDWSAARIDGGDPVAARRALAALLEKHKEGSRARLLFAEAERALGENDWVKNLELACRGDVKISRSIRASCAMGAALQSRLDGDRAAALRKTKAVAQTTEEPVVLGQAALLMATLGEIDLADDVLARARKLADPSMVSLAWAEMAIRLGRMEALAPNPVLERPAGPERDLVALRAAYARGGAQGLAAALKALPPGLFDIDWDVRAYAALAREGGPTRAELLALERRGEKGNPVASYVLGLLAAKDKDLKLAVRRLEKAMTLHGDACRAASVYLETAKALGRVAQPAKAGPRGIHLHNAKCPSAEM